MKCARHLVPRPTLHLIYQALLQPHFDYCSTVWGTCGVTLQDKLQTLQNRATRVLTFSNYDVNAGQLLEILGWKNLDRKRNIQKVTVVFKCLHGLALDYLVSKLSERNTGYNLRDSENKLKADELPVVKESFILSFPKRQGPTFIIRCFTDIFTVHFARSK